MSEEQRRFVIRIYRKLGGPKNEHLLAGTSLRRWWGVSVKRGFEADIVAAWIAYGYKIPPSWLEGG